MRDDLPSGESQLPGVLSPYGLPSTLGYFLSETNFVKADSQRYRYIALPIQRGECTLAGVPLSKWP